jgi:hypothetical protein
VLVVERGGPASLDAVRVALRPLLGGTRLVVAQVPARTIPRTTSGKPRRRELWRRYVAGEFGG